MGVDGQHHAPAALPVGKRHATHTTGGYMGPRAGLVGSGKSRTIWIRSPDLPALSKSLYRLSYASPPPTPHKTHAHIYIYIYTIYFQYMKTITN